MPNTLVSLAGCGRNRHIPFRRRRDDTVCVTGLCSAASLGYEHEIFAAERRAAAACSGAVAAGCQPFAALPIDISCPHGAQQQTRRS